MNRIKPEPKRDASFALGDAPEEEFTFLLVPVVVYSIVSQQAKKENCSVGEVFQKAILQYLKSAEDEERGIQASENKQPVRPAPEIVVTRKKRP